MGRAKLRRNLHLWWRKRREVSTFKCSAAEIGNFRFYQFRPSTAAFFLARLGTTNVTTLDTPHFAFARDLLNGRGRSEGASYYADYIRASWGVKATPEAVQNQLSRFEAHLAAFRKGSGGGPIALTRLEEGGPSFTVDGNHRSAFAAASGCAHPCVMSPFDLVYQQYAPAEEFYGTGSSGVPYQPVFFNNGYIVRGRRSDLRERLEMVPHDVLNGATLLDIASNIGTNSMLAVSMGAKSCLGLEHSENMTFQATRMAVFNNLYPGASFRQFDVEQDALGEQESFDGCFMFSIFSHLKAPERLAALAERHIRKFVVFEGHPGGSRQDYSEVLGSSIFRTVTELGVLPTSTKDATPSRILWLCER